MKELLNEVGKKIAQLFKSGTTWIITILVVGFMFLSWLILESFTELSDGQYHFYMNTKKSLEHIYNKGVDVNDKDFVKFDKYNGNIEKELSTEDELIRKSNRKWKLRYMFK